jgi:hypothetical protein
MNNWFHGCASADRGQGKTSFISAKHGSVSGGGTATSIGLAFRLSHHPSQRRWLFRPRLVETRSRLLKSSLIASTRPDFQSPLNQRRLFESHGILQDQQEIEGGRSLFGTWGQLQLRRPAESVAESQGNRLGLI